MLRPTHVLLDNLPSLCLKTRAFEKGAADKDDQRIDTSAGVDAGVCVHCKSLEFVAKKVMKVISSSGAAASNINRKRKYDSPRLPTKPLLFFNLRCHITYTYALYQCCYSLFITLMFLIKYLLY